MGLNIIFSDSIEALTTALASEAACVEETALLAPPTRIIVPNGNVEKWLKMRLAEANGVALNLEFPYLERGLWALAMQAAGGTAAAQQPTSAEQSRFAVAARLIARLEAGEHGNPLVDFCLGGQASFQRQDANQVRRVWQLSTDLSRLFREYEYHRGLSTLPSQGPLAAGMTNDRDLVGFWAEPGNDLTQPPASLLPTQAAAGRLARTRDLFAAQGALYREAVAALAAGEPAAISLPSLARSIDWSEPIGGASQPITIFGVSQLSPFHCWLLHQLGRHREIRLYHFNLCREFWEDVETPRELRHRICSTDIADGELDLSIENPLLNAWGKGGRETIRLLGGIEETGAAEFRWLPAAARPDSVLGEVQAAIGSRRAEVSGPVQADASLELLACPSLRREVETVYNHIISSMSEDPSLQQNDIAVLVPSMEGYRSIFESTFKARESLRFNLVDSNAGSDSILGNGIQAALALVDTPFTRSGVFALLSNPCVLEAMRANQNDLEQWGQWADTLGIFHHYDASHKQQAGIKPSVHHTWQQGLRRLRLGRILDESPTDAAFTDYPAHSDRATASATLDRFSVWVERLYHRLKRFERARTPADWLETLMQLVDDLFVIPAEMQAEELVLRALRASLREFAGQSQALGFGEHLAAAGCADQSLPLEWVRQYISECLESIPSGHGSYMSDGITLASLLPMRPIPFRRVYILGLGEGEFPGQDTTSTLDLRGCRRRVGDTSRSDVGRYLFLETLMATRERLCLSYVGRDIKKDEEKQPCSVVLQLKAFVDQQIGEAAQWQWSASHVPLNSYSPDFAPALNAAATVGPPQWDLASQLLAYASYGGKGAAAIARELSPQALSASQRAARTAALGALEPAAQRADVGAADTSAQPEADCVVTIAQLASFIKDPAEAVLRYRYGLYAEEDEDHSLAEEEPLETGFPADYQLKAAALRAAFIAAEPDAGIAWLNDAYEQRIRSSVAVDDDFVPFDLDALEQVITERCGRSSAFALLASLGLRAREPDEESTTLKLTTGSGRAVALVCQPRELAIETQGDPWHAGYLISNAGKKGKAAGIPVRALGAFLALYHAIASKDDEPERVRARHLYASHKAQKGLSAYPVDVCPAAALDYLVALVTDFLETPQCDLLPYALLRNRFFKEKVALEPLSPEALREAFEQDQTDSFSTYRMPTLVTLNRDRVAVPDQPAELVARRLLPPLQSNEVAAKAPAKRKGGAA